MYSKPFLQILILIMLSANIYSQNSELNSLIADAIEVNPEIKVLKSKLKIAGSKIDQDSNLPDPMLTLGLMNMPTNSFSFTREPMSGKMIGLTQKIPFPSGLSALAEYRSIDTLIVKKEIEHLENKLRKDVSQSYYDLRLIRQKVKIVEQSRSLFEQSSAVINEKYKSGTSTYQSLISSEIRLTELDDKLLSLMSEEKSALENLNILLYRDLSSPISTLPEKRKAFTFDKEILFRAALKSKPSIGSIRLEQDKAALQEDLADYSGYPDFQIGLQYSQRDYNKITGADYNDFLSVIVGITLPLNYGGKNTSILAEAKQTQKYYAEEYNSKKLMLKQAINKIVEKIDVLNKRIELFEMELLPRSKEIFDASLVDYKVDKTDFTNLIKAQNDLLNTELIYADIKNDYFKYIADLEYQIGKDISNLTEKKNEK